MWRILPAVILFLLSLLVVAKAPTNFFWRVQVAVTEFPYISILVSLSFFISCFYSNSYKIQLILVSAITTLIYCLPVIRVYKRGRNLEEELATRFTFQKKDIFLESPFSIGTLLTGTGSKERAPEVLTYKLAPEKLNLDFYTSASEAAAPCIVVIHGGSWASGDSKQLPALNSYLSLQDYHVAAINYRLAPKYRSPAPVEDTRDAIRFLKQQAEKLNIDTQNFVLLGRSAGAQVALVAAYKLNDPDIKGVISFYGPADMVWGARIPSNKLVLNTDKVFRDYLGGLIDEVPEKYHEASAFDLVNPASPPTLMIHGPHDAMVAYGHSVRLSKKLEENKVPSYFLNLPWATHGCDYNFSGPSGQITTFSIERFLNSVTANSCKNSRS